MKRFICWCWLVGPHLVSSHYYFDSVVFVILNSCLFVVVCCRQLGHRQDLPSELVADYENNEDFLKKVHRAMLEVKALVHSAISNNHNHSVILLTNNTF